MQHTRRFTAALVAVGLTGALTACGQKADRGATAENHSTVERVTTPPPSTPTAAPAIVPNVIQSQPGPAGMVATLNKVQVTGDVLTVQLTITGEKTVTSVPLDEISLIDDSTSQRIGLLKDNGGKWMASPLSGSDNLQFNLYNSPVIVWMKFPAPPATSKTVSLNIPQVAPFDGVPVTR